MLSTFVTHFRDALVAVDARRPQAGSYLPGIGPHDEPRVVELVLAELRGKLGPCGWRLESEVPYAGSGSKCDIVFWPPLGGAWAL